LPGAGKTGTGFGIGIIEHTENYSLSIANPCFRISISRQPDESK
jgi:hypothetical protein